MHADQNVLEQVIQHGSVYGRDFPEAMQTHVWAMVREGLLRSNDQLGERLEATAKGHLRLAELSPNYRPPLHAIAEMERWNDPAALVCRAAALLNGRTEANAKDVSEACFAALRDEQQRLRAAHA